MQANLKSFLDQNHIHYHTINHSPAYTAAETAATAHVKGANFAKAVIVKLDGKMAMVIEPANSRLDLDALKKETGCKQAEIARENEFIASFPDCEAGAMPALGKLYGMDVFLVDHFNKDKEIAFNAGNHHELVQMSYSDFLRLVNPTKVLH